MRSIVVSLAVLSVCSTSSLALVRFDDGAYHLVDYVIDDSIYLDEGRPSRGTHVEVTTGGGVAPGHAYGYVATFGRSRFTLSGGQVGWSIWSYESSEVVVNSGAIQSGIIATDDSTVAVQSVTVNYMSTWDDATVMFGGGSIARSLEVYDNSRVYLSGGHIGTTIFVGDGGARVIDTSRILLQGGSFSVNGHPLAPGQSARDYANQGTYSGYRCLTGFLTGTLANGDSLSNTFYMFDKSDIVYVPEPSTLLLLVVAGLSLVRRP